MKLPKFKKFMRKVMYYSTLHIEPSKIASYDVRDDNENLFKTPKIRISEGGENNMAKRNTNAWTYAETEIVLASAHKGLDVSEISKLLNYSRNEGGIVGHLNNFFIWNPTGSNPRWISKTARKNFKEYVSSNPDKIPTIGKGVENKAVEPVDSVDNAIDVSTAKQKVQISYKALEDRLDGIGPDILMFAQNKAEAAVAEERTKVNGLVKDALAKAKGAEEKLQESEKEIKELRKEAEGLKAYKAKMKKKLEDFLS